MGYTAGSFSAGEQPTTAKWNELWANDSSFNDGTGIATLELGSGHTSLKIDYKFSIYRNASFNSSNVFTAVPHDSKAFDTGSNTDIVTHLGRFTAPVSGFYWFAAACGNTAAGADVTLSALYKNGANTGGITGNSGNFNSSANGTQTGATGILQVAANDFIEHYFQGGNGSAVNTGALNCYFMGYMFCQT